MKSSRKTKLLLYSFFFLLLMAGILDSSRIETHVVTKDEDKVVLSVLAGQSTSDAGIEDMINDAIESKFPNVTLEWECVDWGEKFDSQMLGRLAAGDIPDIMVGKAQDVYAYVKRGNLAPLTLNGMDKIKESALDAVSVDGVLYAIPYNALYQGVLYNRKIFKQLNLSVPKTEKELRKIVKVLKKNNITPFASHFQESWNVGNMTMQFFINRVLYKTPDWGEQFRSNKVNFMGNPEIQSCLKENKYILLNSWNDALVIDQYESDRRFSEGEAAMYLTGTWSVQLMNQYGIIEDYGIFPYPNEEENAKLIRETNISFMKSSQTQYSDLIDKIFEELLANEGLMKEILDFTQTFSVLENMNSASQGTVSGDIIRYEESGNVVEAMFGNKQLIWSFQKDLAAEELKWLQGKQPFEAVFVYADHHRNESSND